MDNLFAGQNSEVVSGGGTTPQRVNRFWIFNNSGVTIPPYGAMEMSSRKTVSAGGYCWNVIKPSADNLTNVCFNEGHPLPTGKFGYGVLDYLNGGLVAAYSGTAPAEGDSIGTASGSFYLKKDNTGFLVFGIDTTLAIAYIGPAAGGGGGSLSVVQALADGASGTVTAKVIALKADLTSSPNFTQTGSVLTLAYFKNY